MTTDLHDHPTSDPRAALLGVRDEVAKAVVGQDAVVLNDLVVATEFVEAAEPRRVGALEGVVALRADWRSARIAEERRVDSVVPRHLIRSLNRVRDEFPLSRNLTHRTKREE